MSLRILSMVLSTVQLYKLTFAEDKTNYESWISSVVLIVVILISIMTNWGCSSES